MSKRQQDGTDIECGSAKVAKIVEDTEDSSKKGSVFVVTVVDDKIHEMQEWTEEETSQLKVALDVDGGQLNWEVIASAVPSKDINQVKEYVSSLMSQAQQESQTTPTANVVKAPVEIWTDLAQKLTSDDDRAAVVCMPQEEVYAVQSELREIIAEQRNKLSKLSAGLRSIKKIVKKTKRQTRNRLAEQNAKIDTLISLLANTSTTTTGSPSNPINIDASDQSTKKRGRNSSSHNHVDRKEKEDKKCSEAPNYTPNMAKNVVPLMTVNGTQGELELSPYSMVIIGQNPDILLTRQQYSDAYFRGKNIRRFAVRLAEKVFGFDALSRSTVMGQQPGLEKLDSARLGAVRIEVLSRFMPSATIDEQEAKWKECLLSIGKKCQVLRSGKALKEELLNPMSSLSDSENISFNSNEQATASEAIATDTIGVKDHAEVTLEECQPKTQIDLVPLGGCTKVLIQKEDLSEAVKRGKKATFLALRLAEKVFGYDVMVESTVTGREGTEKLDNDKLMAIKEEIIRRFCTDQPFELQEAIWKKCLYSISTKCKVLRSQKQNPDGLAIDSQCMSSNATEVGDLDLLANVTCPEEHENLHRITNNGNIVTPQSEEHMLGQCTSAQTAVLHSSIEDQQEQMITQSLTPETVTLHLQQQDVPIHVQDNITTIELRQSNELVGELVQQEF